MGMARWSQLKKKTRAQPSWERKKNLHLLEGGDGVVEGTEPKGVHHGVELFPRQGARKMLRRRPHRGGDGHAVEVLLPRPRHRLQTGGCRDKVQVNQA